MSASCKPFSRDRCAYHSGSRSYGNRISTALKPSSRAAAKRSSSGRLPYSSVRLAVRIMPRPATIPLFGIGLARRLGLRKGLKRGAGFHDSQHGRHFAQDAIEAPRVVHLGNQQDVCHRYLISVTVAAGGGIAGEHGFDTAQPDVDPVPIPRIFGGVISTQFMLQVLEHAQVIQRMDIAGDRLRNGSNPRPTCGVLWKQRRFRVRLFKVFQYGHGLTDGHVAIDQRGDQRSRIQRLVRVGKLLTAVFEQMYRQMLVVDTLEIQRDTYAVGGRAAEIAVQLHQASFSLRESSRGSGKETFSAAPSSVRTEMAPSSLRRSITWRTRISGADAPAVTPTRCAPCSHCGSIISGVSTR